MYDEIVAKLQGIDPEVVASKMFGMPTLKVGGKAFAGQFGDDMVFKLTEPEHAAALALPDAHLFDPMGGRPMKEWVQVGRQNASRWAEFAEAAYRYVIQKQGGK